jgi:hypothetical protein
MAATKLDKTLLKKAALSAWAQAVHTAAYGACQRTGALNKDKEAGRQFKEVVRLVAALIEQLNQIQGPIPRPAAPLTAMTITLAQGTAPMFLQGDAGCDADDQCPDGQICVDGTCESPFPQY